MSEALHVWTVGFSCSLRVVRTYDPAVDTPHGRGRHPERPDRHPGERTTQVLRLLPLPEGALRGRLPSDGGEGVSGGGGIWGRARRLR